MFIVDNRFIKNVFNEIYIYKIKETRKDRYMRQIVANAMFKLYVYKGVIKGMAGKRKITKLP